MTPSAWVCNMFYTGMGTGSDLRKKYKPQVAGNIFLYATIIGQFTNVDQL